MMTVVIGRVNESQLHDSLKEFYRGADGLVEQEVAGFVVDVLLPGEVVEIQTRHLGALKRKLRTLSEQYLVRLVHPVAAIKYIEHVDEEGNVTSRRRSPRRGRLEDAFREISAVAELLVGGRVTLELALVEMTETRIHDGKGSWRRKGVSISGRRLDRILEIHEFSGPEDYRSLLPSDLPGQFTNMDLSEATGLRYRLVQPITSTLRKMEIISIAGKKGNALLYEVV